MWKGEGKRSTKKGKQDQADKEAGNVTAEEIDTRATRESRNEPPSQAEEEYLLSEEHMEEKRALEPVCSGALFGFNFPLDWVFPVSRQISNLSHISFREASCSLSTSGFSGRQVMLDLVPGATRTLAVLHVLPSWTFPPSLRGSAASPVSRIDFPVARFRLLDTLAMALACALVEREALPLSRRHLRPSDCGASLPSFSSVSRQICWTSEQEASEAIPQQGLESPVLSPFLRPLRIAPSQILLHLPARLSPLSSSAHSRASSSTLLLSFEELATLVLPRSSLSAVQGALDSLASNRSTFSGSSSLSSSTSSSFSEWTEAVRDTEGAHSDDEELCFLPGCFLFSAVRKRLSLPSDLSFRLLLGKRELRGNSLIPLSSLLVPTSSEEIEASHSPQSAALYLFSPARRSTSHSSAPPSLASSRSSSRPLFRLAPLLSVHLLFPLVGGKGGFGALLKKQRKKQSRAALNFDMSRDLSGRRIRHAQVVEKIKAWIAKKQQETRAVELLAEQAETLTLEAETKKKEPAPTLDESFVRSLKSNSEQMPMLVGEGLKEEKET
ncbi:telomere stability/silencing protein, partial [Toxoplasma gondii ARI]